MDLFRASLGKPAPPLDNANALASPSTIASTQDAAAPSTVTAQADRLAMVENQLKMLRDTNKELKIYRDQQWFLVGVGTFLAGMLIGLIIPKIRWRRKSWHSF